MMLVGQEVAPERLVFWKTRHKFNTAVSRSCCILGDSKTDVDALRVHAHSPPSTAIRITKEPTQASTRLSFVLPLRSMPTGEEIRLQYRYVPMQGHWSGVTCLLAVDESGRCTPLADAGPAHTSTWQGQVTVSAQCRNHADLLAAGHDSLVWAMELETDPVSCDLIDLSISAGDCWVVFKGTELLRGEAGLRDECEMPAGDDLAGLIRMFETQYDAWGQARRALADEIDYLRRSLDEAHLRPGPGSDPSR